MMIDPVTFNKVTNEYNVPFARISKTAEDDNEATRHPATTTATQSRAPHTRAAAAAPVDDLRWKRC